jgi:hypothetical protein
MEDKRCCCSALVERIVAIGRAQQKMREILDHEIFDTLSKHNPYWDHDTDSEVADKLDTIRRQLSGIQDVIHDAYAELLEKEG